MRAQYIAEENESLKRLIKESIDRIYRVAIENAEDRIPWIQKAKNLMIINKLPEFIREKKE